MPTRRTVLPAVLASALLCCLSHSALAQFSGRLEPAEASFAGRVGDCFDEHKVADLLPPLPPTDVLLILDVSGSMEGERMQLVAYMEQIVDALPPLVGDVAFGVAHLRDHPLVTTVPSCGYFNSYGDPSDAAFTLVQPVTTVRDDVIDAVNALPTATGGGDAPESYSTALQHALDDPAIGWRPVSRRLVLLFTDDIPHDCAPGACLALPTASTGANPGPDGTIGTADDLGIMDILFQFALQRVTLLVIESSGPDPDPGRFVADSEYWSCWAGLTQGLVIPIGPDGTGTSGETLADIIVQLLEDTLDRCPIVELLAEAGYEDWLVSATPVYTDVGAPARLEFDLRICIPPGTADGTHSFAVNLDCFGGTNAQQRVTIEVEDCACGAPALAAGPLASCFPDADAARVAALAATAVSSTCADAPVITAAVTGGCEATITVSSEHPCGDHEIAYLTRIDPDAPVLTGVPATTVASCDAVPAAPLVGAVDGCDGPRDPAFAETRIDGPCPDTYELRRTWSVADACGNAAAEVRSVHVSDGLAPVLAGVPAEATVECDAVAAPASPTASDDCDPDPGVAFAETRTDGPCPGNWELVRAWTATDRCGNAVTESQLVHVRDTTPPVIDASSAVSHCLWPPRHRVRTYRREDFAPVITDTCSGPITWVFAGCASDQPDDGLGDGHTAGDCVVSPDGSTVLVRGERQGMRPLGRTYAVAAVATDACGNASSPTVIGHLHVPHDQSEHPPCDRTP